MDKEFIHEVVEIAGVAIIIGTAAIVGTKIM